MVVAISSMLLVVVDSQRMPERRIIEALRSAGDATQLIKRLAETDNIDRYLLRQVDQNLSGEEKTVMETVAVLLGYYGTREAIETIMDAGSVRRTLSGLRDRFLLSVPSWLPTTCFAARRSRSSRARWRKFSAPSIRNVTPRRCAMSLSRQIS